MDILDISGLYSKKEDNYYEAYERDIAVVHFFFQVTSYLQFNTQGLTLFQEPTIFQFQRSLRMTAIDFISQIGGNTLLLLAPTTLYCPPIGPHHPILASDWLLCPGLLGLFLGFSLISGFELLYWFTLRLGQRLCCQPRHTWAADAL